MVPSKFHTDSIFWIDLDKISPNPYQPRREFDEVKLKGLADSIREYGVLQPVVVTRKEKSHNNGGLSVEYELIAGERRVRASRLAGLSQIPAVIRTQEDDDKAKLEIAIIENLQREDLNPIDRALAFDRLVKEFKFTHVQIAFKIGKSREYVSNTIRLLLLPENIKEALGGKRISEGHTRPLLMLIDRPREQDVLFKEIMDRKLTVREAESIARRIAKERVRKKELIDPEIINIEKELTERLGTRVIIQPKENGGKLVIEFFSTEDLNAILSAISSEDVTPKEDNIIEEEETPIDDSSEEDEDLYSVKNFSI